MEAVSKFFNYLIPVAIVCLIVLTCILVYRLIIVAMNVSSILQNVEKKLIDVDPAVKVVNGVFESVDKGMTKSSEFFSNSISKSKSAMDKLRVMAKNGVSKARSLVKKNDRTSNN